MKNKKTLSQAEKRDCVLCSRRQKILGVIALGGLFVCGVMVGWAISNWNVNPTNITSRPDTTEEFVETDATINKPTCQLVEELLLSRLNDEYSENVMSHRFNIGIYKKLSDKGCPENHDKYQNLIQREQDIINALSGVREDVSSTCEQIESLLAGELYEAGTDARGHINNAQVYANMSERGCAENSARYVELAKRELDVARALKDDKFSDDYDTIAAVDAYKRLHMQAAAEEIFNKAKQLTNPAIDFILQVEKIINE